MINTGNVTLSDVVVNHPLPGLSAITPASVATLGVGDSTVFTATYIVTEADVDAGEVANAAIATANDPGGDEVESNEDKAIARQVM